MNKRRIHKVLEALQEGTEEVRRDPSPSKYKKWEQRIEHAGQENNIWPWVLGIGVVVVFSLSMLGILPSVREDTEQGSFSTVVAVTLATNASRPAVSPTPYLVSPNCPGSPPQRVRIGDRARVCTQYDRLIVREHPGRSSHEITRIYPGTYLTVIDGPLCADIYSWWKIQTDNGIVGWVAEGGGDSVDPYFICPSR